MHCNSATLDTSIKRRAIPEFIAGCIEEIALEGRSGIAVSELYNRLDPQHDLPFREHTWSILRKLTSHLSFHRTILSNRNEDTPNATSTNAPLCSSPRTLKRKRTWTTTLIPVEHQTSPIRGPYSAAHGSKQKRSPQKRTEPFNALKAGKKIRMDENIVTQEDSEHSRRIEVVDAKISGGDLIAQKAESLAQMQYDEAIRSQYTAIEKSVWIIACEEVRLRHLGVMDPFVVSPCSVLFDLLELLGRARERGESAAELSKYKAFGGDARKFHYLLDVLTGAKLIVKNIVSVKGRRFNMLHLKRFAPKCMADIGNVKGTMEKESYPRELICMVMAKVLRLRRQKTCVLADIARELGISKGTQEKLRNYLLHEAYIDPEFPLEIFMARCNASSHAVKTASNGRKLWCLRLRHDSAIEDSDLNAGQDTCKGAVVEIGVVEQIYNCIKRKKKRGATIPEIRDVLGVPTFRLPYKLAQGLIAQYNIDVERVLVGKNTMYRMFVPSQEEHTSSDVGALKKDTPKQPPSFDETTVTLAHHAQAILHAREVTLEAPASNVETREIAPSVRSTCQPASIKEALSHTVKIPCIREKRRQFAIDLVRKELIISNSQLRNRLIDWERRLSGKNMAAECSQELSTIATRSVRKIINELLNMEEFKAISVVVPARMGNAHTKAPTIKKCIGVREVENDTDRIEEFLRMLKEERRTRLRDGSVHKEHKNFIVLSKNRKTIRSFHLPIRKENENVQVINFLSCHHKTVRKAHNRLRKQSRRLGQYHGIMYRCRALHLLMWKKMPQLRHSGSKYSALPRDSHAVDNDSDQLKNTEITATKIDKATCAGEQIAETITKSDFHAEQLYSPQNVLDTLSLKEFIMLLGVSNLLTDQEETQVRSLISSDDSWNKLDHTAAQKIRNGEIDRLYKLLVVLEELNLVEQVKGSPSDYLLALQSSSDQFDEAISQVALATLSGGFFRIRQCLRITLQSGDTILSSRPHESVDVYTSIPGREPLHHTLKTYDDAEKYWKSLEVLSLKGGHSNCLEKQIVDKTDEVLRSAALTTALIHSKISWTPSGLKYAQKNVKTQIADASTTLSASFEQSADMTDRSDTAQGTEALYKKRHSNAKYIGKLKKEALKNATEVNLFRKDKRLGLSYVEYVSQLVTNEKKESKTTRQKENGICAEQNEEGFSRMPYRPHCQSIELWKPELDAKLLELYIERASYQWFIDVPVALQAQDEPTAFRNTRLKRSLLGWHSIGQLLEKPKLLCKRRVKELMELPNNKAQYENVKKSVTALKNPNEIFHEELEIIQQPRLAALHSRALQIVFHDEASYEPSLAAMLLSNWKDDEAQLVWRYLWLAGVIRVPKTRKDQTYEHQRNFTFRIRFFNKKHCSSCYPLQFFLGATEYANFQKENSFEAGNQLLSGVDGCELKRNGISSAQNYVSCLEEHELVPNLVDSHMAIELSYMAMGLSHFSIFFIEPLSQNDMGTKVRGFEAHLSQYFNIASSDYFLQDSWCVTSRFLSDDSCVDETTAQMQAFSTHQDSARPCEPIGITLPIHRDIESWILQQLDRSKEEGLSYIELQHSLRIEVSKKFLEKYGIDGIDCLQRVLDTLVTRKMVWYVSAYEGSRYVLAEHAAIWLIPQEKKFDHQNLDLKWKNTFCLSQPWLLLDGNTNVDTALMLKRRICNSLLSNPGLTDRMLHRTMRKIVSLQNLRVLLDEMVAEKIIYRRILRSRNFSHTVINDDTERKQSNVFEVAFEIHKSNHYGTQNTDRTLRHISEIYKITSGDLRYAEMKVDKVHYFPTVQCVEALGSVASELLH
ncbi:hypothetical protein ABG067_001396 [Albugo candida]